MSLKNLILENEGDREDIYQDVLELIKKKEAIHKLELSLNRIIWHDPKEIKGILDGDGRTSDILIRVEGNHISPAFYENESFYYLESKKKVTFKIEEWIPYDYLLQPKKKTLAFDHVIMPKRLTAENGAKALINGEFIEDDGEGNNVVVKWTTIKDIYKMAVKHLSKTP